MSIGSLGGIIGSAAGAPLSQTKGSETDRAQHDAAAQDRVRDSDKQADNAAGIGQTDQDEGASERDADGRRLWERPEDENSENEQSADAHEDSAVARNQAARQCKDPTGVAGNKLDLTG